jgi:CRP/FNR family transcriptional regulator, dissimilatory nitrate respiration regulator
MLQKHIFTTKMSKLFQCPLFKGMVPDEITNLLANRYDVKTYRSGELIALQSSLYDHLLIVTEGLVRAEMTDAMGRNTLIEEIQAPRAIAPAFLYASENRLPVAIIAAVPTEITVIRRSQFTALMQQDARLLTNYLQSMADRSRFLSEKLRMQRFGTIKSKLARYLLELSQRLANGQAALSEFTIQHTQQQLADLFGVTRPALARTIKQLEDEKIIRTKSKQFSILDRKKLMEW